jgi:hypothetical protein
MNSNGIGAVVEGHHSLREFKPKVDVIPTCLVAMVKPELATEEERTVAIDLKGLKRASRD